MRRYCLLGFWLVGILFPLGWLGSFSTSYRQAFNAAFGAETTHVVMHFILYMSLVVIGFWSFNAQLTHHSLIISLALILCIGMVQELFQALSSGNYLPWAIMYDLVIDLTGGAMGLILIAAWKHTRKLMAR